MTCRIGLLVLAAVALGGCRNYGPSRGEKMRQLFVGFLPGQSARDAAGLLSESAAVRRESLLRIARRDDVRAVPAIALMVREDLEKAPLVRVTAAAALRRLGARTAAPGLVASLGDQNMLVRREIVITLGCVGNETHLPLLEDLARRDGNAGVREAAVRAIARIGGRPAVMSLIRFVEDRDDLLSYTANHALCRLTGQRLPPSRRRWEEWRRENRDRAHQF